MINPDLVTSRHDTETERLNNYSIKTPERRPNRRIKIQDPRLGPIPPRGRMNKNTSQLKEIENMRRSPTPIKIVDLSAKPLSMSGCISIKKEY